MKICTVCKSDKIELFLTIDELNYWLCNVCESKFLDSKNYVNLNYEKKHYLKHNNSINDFKYLSFLLKLVDPLKYKISTNHIGLDYGCGYSPALAYILKKEGFKVELYDPFFYPDKSVFLRKFNFVTCSEVVEHFFYPFEEFQKIDNLMCSNSWLGVMTSFLPSDKLFQNWYYRKDPTHVVFYKEKTFKIIASQRNWKVSFPSKNIVLFNKK